MAWRSFIDSFNDDISFMVFKENLIQKHVHSLFFL